MTNRELAAVFHNVADLMELRGDNEFKLRAYRNAAQLIEDLSTPVAELAAQGGAARLRELPGIGAAISQKIVDLLATGTFNLYEELKADIPLTVLDLLKLDGVSMKLLQILYGQFQLTNLDDFAKFVAGGGLNSVPRLGEKAQTRIRTALRELGY